MSIVEGKLALASNRMHSVVGHDDIHRQSVKPGRQRASPAKKVQLPPGPNERFLGKLLGEVCVASEAPTQPVNPSQLLSVDLFESLPIAVLSSLHEPFRLFRWRRNRFDRAQNRGDGVLHATLDASARVLV